MKSKSTKIFTTILICVLVVLALVVIVQFANLVSMKTKKRELQKAYDQTMQQLNTCTTGISYVTNNHQDYLEEYAREVLNWGQSGKTYFVSR